MNTSYRYFVVQGDEVTHISQKAFNAFYFRGKAELTQYSNQAIVVAVIYYETKRRKPTRILKMDAIQLRVRPDGSVDESDVQKRIRALALAVTSSDGVTDLTMPEVSPVARAKMESQLIRSGGPLSA
ncbi:MAG: hypothetical protein CVU22_00925 [Betaproteobacteria bacterium HGW-Betaproteobacteria-16]|nr:MAG: hypothetical protein CVU22_00925 [Betaproteobacteria bacterium HGW-Betaproteobacteria-16]